MAGEMGENVAEKVVKILDKKKCTEIFSISFGNDQIKFLYILAKI